MVRLLRSKCSIPTDCGETRTLASVLRVKSHGRAVTALELSRKASELRFAASKLPMMRFSQHGELPGRTVYLCHACLTQPDALPHTRVRPHRSLWNGGGPELTECVSRDTGYRQGASRVCICSYVDSAPHASLQSGRGVFGEVLHGLPNPQVRHDLLRPAQDGTELGRLLKPLDHLRTAASPQGPSEKGARQRDTEKGHPAQRHTVDREIAN
jgi:hypothetical protein